VPGSYCAGGAAQPAECAPGSIASSANMSACELCPAGRYAASRTACEECGEGTYSVSKGLSQCIPCPHPLSAERGSVTCAVCKADYYLLGSEDPVDIFAFPTKHCKLCPPHADCSAPGTTLETLGVPPGFWRASKLTTELHKCVASAHCSGSGGTAVAERSRRLLAASGASGDLGSGEEEHGSGDPLFDGSWANAEGVETRHGDGCNASHTGPRCEWCIMSELQYFDHVQRGCVDCPAAGVRLVILFGVLFAAAATGVLFYLALTRIAACGRLGARAAHRLKYIELSVGFQPKLKVLVSFYQIGATLGPVYGVRLHESLTRWTDILDAFSLDVLGLTYPDSCIGSMRARILLSALWPILVILLGAAALASHTVAVWLLSDRAGHLRSDLGRATLGRVLYWAILVAYLVLPSVSRSIFKARKCESFSINVLDETRRSYLMADLDVLCSADDDKYRELDLIFWSFFVLWPVLVPLTFLVLLLSLRPAVRAQRISPLANACRFLWHDYDADFIFWEVAACCAQRAGHP